MNITLRKLYLFASILAAFSLTTSCGSDDNGGSNGNGDGTQSANVNKNTVTDETAVGRIEFPKLHGGSSIVLVHRTADTQYDADGVNYSVEWDCEKKSARWTCYVLTNSNKAQNVSRYSGDRSKLGSLISTYTGDEEYPKDPLLNDSYYFDRDYMAGSGFDHGHICPSNDRRYSSEANKQTFYLTNMQPQYSVFNGSDKAHQYKGLWLSMENFVNGYKLNLTDTMYVCKGGTIDSEDMVLQRIKNKMIVPKYFFAAVLLKRSTGYRAIGFWFEHSNEYHGDDSLTGYAVTIDKLEELTGIDFFCNLPDNIENSVESTISTLQWGL